MMGQNRKKTIGDNFFNSFSSLQAMQESLMSTLKELLNHQWTSETEDAWNRLFHFISSTMIKGLQSQ